MGLFELPSPGEADSWCAVVKDFEKSAACLGGSCEHRHEPPSFVSAPWNCPRRTASAPPPIWQAKSSYPTLSKSLLLMSKLIRHTTASNHTSLTQLAGSKEVLQVTVLLSQGPVECVRCTPALPALRWAGLSMLRQSHPPSPYRVRTCRQALRPFNPATPQTPQTDSPAYPP